MSYEETKIGKLIDRDPEKAASRLLALLKRTGGNMVHAALHEGVHHSTLKRWVSKLDDKYKMRSKIEQIRETTPRSKQMKAETKEKLESQAAEARRVAGLRRTFGKLTGDEVEKLSRKVGHGVAVLQSWADGMDLEDPVELELQLEKIQARRRKRLREANREYAAKREKDS